MGWVNGAVKSIEDDSYGLSLDSNRKLGFTAQPTLAVWENRVGLRGMQPNRGLFITK